MRVSGRWPSVVGNSWWLCVQVIRLLVSSEERPQPIPGLLHRPLPSLERLAEGVVLDLDADGTAIGGRRQRAEEIGPVDPAVAGDARLVPFERVGEDTHLVEAVAADFHVLGVEMEQFVL